MKTKITFILSLLLVMSMSAQKMSEENSIVKNATISDSHKILVKAVKAAGLVKILDSEGPFTVFAPTDEAFNKVPNKTLKALLRPENKGKVKVETISGEKLVLYIENDNVLVRDQKGNTATVQQADLNSSNGVIHVVDTVLMP